jgi:hypothetical protein
MSERGKPSTAHEYNQSEACIHCGVYKVNIEKMSLNCTPAREKFVDAKAGKKAG